MKFSVGAGGTFHEVTGTKPPKVGVGSAWHSIKAIWAGKTGAWHQVFQLVTDTSGPTVASFTVTGLSNGDMRFAWSGVLATDATAVASVKIQGQYTPFGGSGEGWADVQTVAQYQWEGSGGSFDFTPSTSKRRQWSASYPYAETVSAYYYGFRVVAVDSLGNTTTTSEVKALTKPYGTFNVVPQDQDSAVSGTWQNLTTHAVRSGDNGGGTTYDYGCYFYSTAIADNCLGYTPDSGGFYIQRWGNGGSSGTWNMYQHDLATSSGTATMSGTAYGAAISGTDDSETCTMPSDWLAPFATGAAKGIAVDSTTSYRVLRTWFEDFSDSGHLWLVFN